MAGDGGQSTPHLKEPRALSKSYDFFELMRQLENDGGTFGHAGGAGREPARIGQHVRLTFATSDIAHFTPANGNVPAKVEIANIGLLGPEGPMPLHVTRWVLDRLSQRWFVGNDAQQTSDTTFVDFINVLQHRIIALFYRAWADANPAVQVERRFGGQVRSLLKSMAGLGLPRMEASRDADLEVVKLRQAGALASQVDGPERLTLFIAEAFDVPVRLEEFVASWIDVPRTLQTRIGKAYGSLGKDATIGPRVFSRQNRIELVIGPLNYETFLSFLPGGKKLVALKSAIRDLTGEWMDVDLRIVLAKAAVPKPKLGNVQLGRTTWLARPAEWGDATDMRLRTIVGWRPVSAGAEA